MTYHGSLRVRTGLTLLDCIIWVQQRLNQVNKRFLCQHGSNDIVCELEGSRKLMEQSATPEDQKTLLVYDGVGHEMTRGEGNETIMRDWLAWLIQTDELLHNDK
jgi:esterase/lipase